MTSTANKIRAARDFGKLREAIAACYHLDEDKTIENLLPRARATGAEAGAIAARARQLVETVRARRRTFGGLDSFLQEFGLTTREGIALMCLAEALLRIPDAETADRLIRDKIGSAEWDRHVGKGPDLFVNASTWALMLTGKVLGEMEGDDLDAPASGIMGRMVSKLGEPVVRRAMYHAMKILGKQFVLGRTIDEALREGAQQEKDGYCFSFDMLGEAARTAADADRYFKSYEAAIAAIGSDNKNRRNSPGVDVANGISVKLSALHPRFEYAQAEKCVPALSDRLKQLALQCRDCGIGLTVDAEEASRLDLSLDIIENVFTDPALAGWGGFGLAVQAYQKRAYAVIEWLEALAEETGERMMVRLVKGAYWDSEIKYAQVNGLPGYPVFTRKASTDVSYIACARRLLARRDLFYPMFATHNAQTVATILTLAGGGDPSGFEFQRLHGMGEPLYHQIAGPRGAQGKTPCRVYAPVGSHEDLLPYLVRRLLENGANSSFVNRIQNDQVAIADIIADPAEYVANLSAKPHPKIPLPGAIYGEERKNSAGVELANGLVSEPLLKDIRSACQNTWRSAPIVGGKLLQSGSPAPVLSPCDRRITLGTVVKASEADVEQALTTTARAFYDWCRTDANTRARALERAADLMEEHRDELLALCIREAGKTIPDAIAELREAVDFCRYYAAEGRKHFSSPLAMPGPTGELNQLSLRGRGVFLCVSPWNFPLAIFMGQVAAALMAGNCVIAKPSDQTQLIAFRAVQILHEAGIPADVLAFLPISGRIAGKLIVPDERIAGICFTGSTETAQTINQTLAARKGPIVPFIAETGGQNCMIADSSALPEQVVDDVITSAFRSTGQRCSALRVLFLQDDVADKILSMLKGAAEQLVIDDPIHLSTDIGPVIDEASRDTLRAHADLIAQEGKLLFSIAQQPGCEHGVYFSPRAVEINAISQLSREVFGPVLHVIRYSQDRLDDVLAAINSTGYGLTLGLHTRIDHVMRIVADRINVGNAYINRSMIGAVVGVQPFGGQGLSGTGPKAGGPFYLHRFTTERTLTVNTTASGGNTTLVSLGED